MQKRVKRPPRQKMRARHKFLLAVFFLLALLAFSLVSLEQKVRPVALTIAQYECRDLCIHTMQNAVNKTIDERPELYKELYDIQRDSAGQIVSVACDTLRLNQLQNDLEETLSKSLDSLGRAKLAVPLGTLTGVQALAGLGPELTVRAIPLSNVESKVESRFSSAGVNQTKLEVNVTFTVELCAMLAGAQAETTVTSEVCVAQMLIVGQVPEFYAQGGDLAGKM